MPLSDFKRLRSGTLNNAAPMRCVPENEQGVVLLFGDYARKHRLEIECVQQGFPDCIAYQATPKGRRRIRIEFEFRSKSFALHKHSARGCDWIVCWEHDWPDAPKHLFIIELRQEYGLGRRIWIKSIIEDHVVPGRAKPGRCCVGGVPGQARIGDLVLHRLTDQTGLREWRDEIWHIVEVLGLPRCGDGDGWDSGWRAEVKRICSLRVPISADDLAKHPVMRSAGHLWYRSGREYVFHSDLDVTTYWYQIRELIVRRNPHVSKRLLKYAVTP